MHRKLLCVFLVLAAAARSYLLLHMLTCRMTGSGASLLLICPLLIRQGETWLHGCCLMTAACFCLGVAVRLASHCRTSGCLMWASELHVVSSVHSSAHVVLICSVHGLGCSCCICLMVLAGLLEWLDTIGVTCACQQLADAQSWLLRPILGRHRQTATMCCLTAAVLCWQQQHDSYTLRPCCR